MQSRLYCQSPLTRCTERSPPVKYSEQESIVEQWRVNVDEVCTPLMHDFLYGYGNDMLIGCDASIHMFGLRG